jgi:hypothetical protein
VSGLDATDQFDGDKHDSAIRGNATNKPESGGSGSANNDRAPPHGIEISDNNVSKPHKKMQKGKGKSGPTQVPKNRDKFPDYDKRSRKSSDSDSDCYDNHSQWSTSKGSEFEFQSTFETDSFDSDLIESSSSSGSQSKHKRNKKRKHKSKSKSKSHKSKKARKDLEGYMPIKESDKHQWKFDSRCRDYTSHFFNTYVDESTIRETVENNPIPNHSFIKNPNIDRSIMSIIHKHPRQPAISAQKNRDRQLSHAHEKILRVMGPLGKLFNNLCRAQSQSRSRSPKVDIDKLVTLCEKAVLFAGQAHIGMRYTRRLHLLTSLLGKMPEAKSALRNYSVELDDEQEQLFGDAFAKAIRKDRNWANPWGSRKFPKPNPNGNNRQVQNSNNKKEPFPQGATRGRGGWVVRGKQRGGGKGGITPPSGRPTRYVHLFSRHGGCKSTKRNRHGSERPNHHCISKGHKSYRTSKGSRGIKFRTNKFSLRSGGTDSICPSELAENNVGSSNLIDDSGLQAGVYRTTTESHLVQSSVFCTRTRTHRKRSSTTNSKRGNSGGQTMPKPSGEPHIFETKIRWLPETDNKLNMAQSAHKIRTFQDGGITSSPISDKTRGLHGEGRSEGCLLLSSDSSQLPEVLEVPMGEKTLPIQRVSVWPCPGSPMLHKSVETSNLISSEVGLQISNLPGRLSSHESVPSDASIGGRITEIDAHKSGVRNQLKKVNVHSFPEDRISGNDRRLADDDIQSLPAQDRKDPEQMSQYVKCASNFSPAVSELYRIAFIHDHGSLASPSSLSETANDENKNTSNQSIVRSETNSRSSRKRGNSMVDSPPSSSEWQSHQMLRTGCDTGDGCEQPGLGRSLSEWGENERPLDEHGIGMAYQCSRVESSVFVNENTIGNLQTVSCTPPDGQSSSSGVLEQDGRYEVLVTSNASGSDLGVLHAAEHHFDSGLYPGGPKLGSRPVITSDARSERLAVESKHIQCDQSNVGSFLDRSFCQQTQCSGKSLCELESGPSSRIYGRNAGGLEQGTSLCFPTFLHGGSVPPEANTGQKRVNTHRSSLAVSTVVRVDVEPSYSRADSVAPRNRSAEGTNEPDPSTSGKSDALPSRVAALSTGGNTETISSEAKKFVEGALRPSTRSTYDTSYKRWVSWCDSRGVDPISAPVERVVDFLANMAKEGRPYSTINGYRSAISNKHVLVNGSKVGQHELVIKVMAGIWNSNPPLPRYQGTWDVDILLNHIRSMGSNTTLSDKDLTHKLATLLALSSSSRVSELSMFTLDHFVDNGNEVVFSLPPLTKTSRVGSKPLNVVIKCFEQDVCLCPVDCVRYYIKRTASWRQTVAQHKLFLALIGKHKPVQTSTISGWMLSMLSSAGIDTDTFKSHSIRSAGTSKALRGGVSIGDILARANWSNVGTFRRFYCRADNILQTEPFEKVVLAVW